MNTYCIMVTYKCQWDCKYCIVNTHSQPEVDFKTLQQKLSQIPNGAEVSLSGGEPGLLDKESMKYVFETLIEKQCYIKVNTNGLFFKTYPEYDKYVRSYLYHFSENLVLEQNYYIPTVDHSKITFMLVVTNENTVRLEDFLNKFNTLKFSIFSAVKNNIEDDTNILSKKNAFDIFKKYKHRINKESYSSLLLTCIETQKQNKLITL